MFCLWQCGPFKSKLPDNAEAKWSGGELEITRKLYLSSEQGEANEIWFTTSEQGECNEIWFTTKSRSACRCWLNGRARITS
uniref:Uncharacterized protein n=1 Tax=Hyaloperonospora arabidopsidis (strain Emoy2) TaxID=559515 RepID=M4BTL0_HYAAE